MQKVYEEVLLRKYQPSPDELWRVHLTRPGVTIFVKTVVNVKTTMRGIMGRGVLALPRH